MKLYIFLLISLCSLSNTYAQPAVGSWSILGPVDQPLRTRADNGNGVGRVSRIKFHPTDSQKIYAVSNQGGIFISKDRGRTWHVTAGTDALPKVPTSCVCVDYSDDNILYLGTGDGDTHDGYALGIWKSADGGATFTQSTTGIGNRHITEMIMSPTDHNTLLAGMSNGNATTGHAVYKSTDGGATWVQKLSLTRKPDDIQIKLAPSHTVYVATGTALYSSTDFGDTWTATSLPVPSTNNTARIALTPADTNVIYYGATMDRGYILKSTDGGASFTNMYTGSKGCIVCYDTSISSGSQGEYNFTLCVNPLNANELLMGSENVFRSLDGGINWTMVQEAALAENLMWDYHNIVFDPYYPNEVFLSCDGGIWSTVDTLKTLWRARNVGICALQSYRAAQHPLFRDVLTCATQDCGEHFYNGNNHWNYIGGGDMFGPHYFDYRPGYNIWSTNVHHLWQASDTQEVIESEINIPFITAAYPGNIYMAFSNRATNYALMGQDTLYICNNIGAASPSWTNILNNKYQVRDMRFCLADSNICYLLNKSDTLYRSDNVLAASPSFVKMKMPTTSSATGFIATSKNRSNLVYVSANAKVYESKDKGATWTDISYNLPTTTNIMGLVHDDYSSADRLLVASGTGVYYKDSADVSWTLISGYPTITPLNELMLYNDGTAASILRVATYGRGVWECPINNDKKPLISTIAADKQHICPGDTVHYSLNYYGVPTSIAWSFPGGSPSSSTSSNPVVVYSTAGTYNAQAIVSNAAGADTVIKTSYIVANTTAAATLSEGFEKNIFPPSGWLYPAPIGIYGWHITDKVGGRSSSIHSLVFDNYNHDAKGAKNNFVTAPIDLTGKAKAKVTFDIAYQYTYGYNDSLVVAASTDCGDNWVPVYTNGGLSMATAIQAPVLLSGANFFSPTASQWRTDTINLNAYLGNTVLLSFINIGRGGSTLYLDNINLSTVKVGIEHINGSSPAVTIFPNPTSGQININISSLTAKKAKISCYNILGELVKEQINTVNNNFLQTTLSLSGLPTGVYQLKLQADNGFNYNSKVALQ